VFRRVSVERIISTYRKEEHEMCSVSVFRMVGIGLVFAALLAIGGLPVSSQTETEELPPFIITSSFPDNLVAFVDLFPDGSTQVTHVQVAEGPSGVAVHPSRLFTYVVSWTAKALTVLDNRRRTGIRALSLGSNLYAVAFRPDGEFAYITDAERKRLIVLDTRDPANPRLFTFIALPGAQAPRNLAFTPDGHFAFVSDSESGRVQVIDAQAHRQIGVLDTGGRCAVGVAVDPFGNWLYVSDRCLSTVYAVAIASISGGSPEITPIPLPGQSGAWHMAFSPFGRFAFVSQTEPREWRSNGEVAVIDVERQELIGSVHVGGLPAGLKVVLVNFQPGDPQGWQYNLFVFNPGGSIDRINLNISFAGPVVDTVGPYGVISVGLSKELAGELVLPPPMVIQQAFGGVDVNFDNTDDFVWYDSDGDGKDDAFAYYTGGGDYLEVFRKASSFVIYKKGDTNNNRIPEWGVDWWDANGKHTMTFEDLNQDKDFGDDGEVK